MGTLSGHVVAPSPVGAGTLETTAMIGSAVAPAATASGSLTNGFALSGTATAPAAQGSGAIVAGRVLSGTATAPAARGSGALVPHTVVTAPAARGAGVLLNGSRATGAATAPAAQGSGVLSSQGHLVGVATAPKFQATGGLLNGRWLSGGATARVPRAYGRASAGTALSGAATAPAARGSGALALGQILAGAGTAPSAQARGSLINDLVESFVAWLLNTEGGGVSKYSNYDFHSLVEWNGSYYAASENGIYELGGDTDDGADIGATLTFGVTDLGSELMTRLGTVVLDLRAAGNLQLHVTVDGEDETYSYTVEPLRAGLHPVPVPTGRELRSRNWQFSLTNVQGADFDINALTFTPHRVNRKAG